MITPNAMFIKLDKAYRVRSHLRRNLHTAGVGTMPAGRRTGAQMITEEQVRPRTAAQYVTPAPIGDPPARRLSPVRVLVLLAVVAGATFGVCKLAAGGAGGAAVRHQAPAFAPYVDVTLTPTYPFQSPAANPVAGAYLGFVVSKASAPCTPTWGGYYTLSAASTALDLDARVAQLRAQGGRPMISFGGQAGTDLAVTCTDPAKLAAAYLAPITRYHASTIDLDLEGASLADAGADADRAAASVSRSPTLVSWRRSPPERVFRASRRGR